MSLKAVTHISQVRGGSQARIMLADDGRKYVTKLHGQPTVHTECWPMTTWPADWRG